MSDKFEVEKIKRKSQVWVSAILYTLVATIALVLILEAGIPILERLKDTTTFSKTKDALLNLDEHINEVASEGEGAQRIVNLEIKEGKLIIAENQINWEFETDNRIVDPRTSQRFGNLIITSNANVQTTETDEIYILKTTIEDDSFSAKINKIGTESSWQEINTSGLIDSISFNDNELNGTFFFSINGIEDSSYGKGYTELVPSGNNTNLGRAKVIAHINSSFAEYDLEFILESYADFLITKVKNFEPK
ncbi:hypothetical protein JXB41_03115 [Candidatus Woesearchaeota archaeon]|nr:hypothetical protein [Candidatus Woesearchaeota archaeon]